MHPGTLLQIEHQASVLCLQLLRCKPDGCCSPLGPTRGACHLPNWGLWLFRSQNAGCKALTARLHLRAGGPVSIQELKGTNFKFNPALSAKEKESMLLL